MLIYREGESPYGMVAVCGRVESPPAPTPEIITAAFVWVRVAGHRVLARQLDEEGVEWARVDEGQVNVWGSFGGWTDLVPGLLAAQRLAGIGDST